VEITAREVNERVSFVDRMVCQRLISLEEKAEATKKAVELLRGQLEQLRGTVEKAGGDCG
jgi:hypothetical protein